MHPRAPEFPFDEAVWTFRTPSFIARILR